MGRDRVLGGGPLSASDLGARASRCASHFDGQRRSTTARTSTPSTTRCSRSATQARRSSSSPGARESAAGCGGASRGRLAAGRCTAHRRRHAARLLRRCREDRRACPSPSTNSSPVDVAAGPAIVESAVTTVVVDPGATVERTASGSLAIVPAAVTAAQIVEAVAT